MADKDVTVPRLLHKGDARMRVETKEELDAATGKGWGLHHDPPKVVADVDLSVVPAGAAVAQIAEITDLSQLEALRNAEVGHPKVAEARAGVLKAIDARIATLKAVHTAPVPKGKEPGPATPGGSVAVLDGTVPDVMASVNVNTNVADLKALRAAEARGSQRSGVLSAIDARLDALKTGG